MPKIERSVDYTFEAYSGVDELDPSATGPKHNKGLGSNQADKECHNSSDIDDESMFLSCNLTLSRLYLLYRHG